MNWRELVPGDAGRTAAIVRRRIEVRRGWR